MEMLKSKSLQTVFILLFYSIATSVTGQIATVNKVWLEHNVNSGSDNGLWVHSNIDVSGMKGKKIRVIAFFYDENKKILVDQQSQNVTEFRNHLGQVLCFSDSKPTYDNSNYSDYKIFIPYRALPLTPTKRTYYVHISVFDMTSNRYIDNNYEQWEGFTGSRGAEHTPQYNDNQQSIAYMDIHSKYSQYKKFGGDRVVRSEKDTDGKDYVFYYANGWVERIGYDECSNCHGRPTCDYCGGKGYTEMWIISNAVRTTCIPCKGSGGCYFCNGEGVSRFIDARNERTRLGYVKLPYTGGTLVSLDDNKNTGGSYNTGNYNPNLSSGNYTPSGSNKIRCHSCGGSGRCGFCGGRGEKRNSYSGNLNDCDMCRGGGVCSLCRGKGVN